MRSMKICLSGRGFSGITAGGIAMLATTLPAFGQEVDTFGASVTSREASRLRQGGVRTGSFLVLPSVQFDLAYNDNIRATETNPVSDGIATIRPQVAIESNWNNHSFRLDGRYQRSANFENSSENASEYGTVANGRLDISRQTQLSGTLEYNRLAERRGDLGSFQSTAERVKFSTFGGALRLDQRLGDLTVRAEGRVQRWRYDDVRLQSGAMLDQRFRDFDVVSGSLQTGYSISPITQVFARATVETRRYDLRPGDIGFDPITGVDRSADSYRLEFGVQRELTQLLLATVRFGYLNFRYPDPTVQDLNVFAYFGTVRWNVTPLTSIYLDTERSVDETVSPVTAGNLRDEVRLRVDHELLRKLVVTGRARLGWINPSVTNGGAGFIFGKSRERQFEVEARYYLKDRFRLQFAARHQARTSDANFFNFKSNTVSVGLHYAL
jgi:hypothetical protein